MDYIFTPAAQVSLPIEGMDAAFPVRRIYCIGRNYADHAIEMGHDPDREAPFFFQKNAQNIDISGTFPYPPQTSDVHHEIELVVALKSGGANISEDDAMQHVYGYAIALDMTRRDLQGEAKKTGRPWEIGKAFERSAPMSALVPASKTGHLDAGRISLSINGEIRQDGDLNQMIWKVPEMISYLSRFYDITAGDLIMSGTPAGVGPVAKGDVLTGDIEGLGRLVTQIV
ncbi:fumarylacetoacetate hydrolase family protein [Candidatus Puniceispirillum marinum]|uniref:Fumarylacetoacetate (FAA) hydrolase n=1 Tax=Puniceispirillum marinum (strain IMCC1322) TaxID=488538 RepID=D5BTW1_PUNMI|nr:fumarylacetoacetate (FAA) hydrolase [Candidatus Puniceispirillum marinum IMCC1322]